MENCSIESFDMTTSKSDNVIKSPTSSQHLDKEQGVQNVSVPLLLSSLMCDPRPEALTPSVIHRLQSTHGNRFVMRLAQKAGMYPYAASSKTPDISTHTDPGVSKSGAAAEIQRMLIRVEGFPHPVDTSTQTLAQLYRFMTLLNDKLEKAKDRNEELKWINPLMEVKSAIEVGDYKGSALEGLPNEFKQRFGMLCSQIGQQPDHWLMEKAESKASVKAGNDYGGQIKTIMKPSEMQGLVQLCKSLTKKRPVENFAYIMLGNSTAPLTACFLAFQERFPGVTLVPLPMSEIDESAFTRWNDDTERTRMVKHIGTFLQPQSCRAKSLLL